MRGRRPLEEGVRILTIGVADQLHGMGQRSLSFMEIGFLIPRRHKGGAVGLDTRT